MEQEAEVDASVCCGRCAEYPADTWDVCVCGDGGSCDCSVIESRKRGITVEVIDGKD